MHPRFGNRLLATVCLLTGLCFGLAPDCPAEDATSATGRELFLREWIPSDSRSAGGDGLGPVFNETSCVACHNQGGAGGAGPASKNVQIVSVFSNEAAFVPPSDTTLVGIILSILGSRPEPPKPSAEELQAKIKDERERLMAVHPGFRTARSLVLHRASTDGDYAAFRGKLAGLSSFAGMGSMDFGLAEGIKHPQPALSAEEQETLNGLKVEGQLGGLQALSGSAQVNGFTLLLSERNASPLFGSGSLDRIPDAELVAAAAKKFDDYPDVSGRAEQTEGRPYWPVWLEGSAGAAQRFRADRVRRGARAGRAR